MIKPFRYLTVLAALAAFASIPRAAAQEDEASGVSVSLSLDNASKYIWRGIQVNDEQVLQPSLTLGYGDFSFNVWANYDMTDTGLRGDDNVSEVDYTLKYAHTFDDTFSVEAGVIAYVFPGAQDINTNEVFVGVGLPGVPLVPTLKVYYDFEEADGFYATLGISHSFVLTDDEKLSLNLVASVGAGDSDYNAYYFGVDDDGVSDALLSAGLAYKITDKLSAGISVNYAEILDSDLEDAADATFGDSDNLWTVFNVGYTF